MNQVDLSFFAAQRLLQSQIAASRGIAPRGQSPRYTKKNLLKNHFPLEIFKSFIRVSPLIVFLYICRVSNEGITTCKCFRLSKCLLKLQTFGNFTSRNQHKSQMSAQKMRLIRNERELKKLAHVFPHSYIIFILVKNLNRKD